MVIVGISIMWLCAGITVGILLERHRNIKVSTPSASNNTAMPKLPPLEECMFVVGHFNDFTEDNVAVKAAKYMHHYIRRQLRQ